MKLMSWNVNGLRACLEKGFTDVVRTLDADIVCVQETKMQEGQAEIELPGYHQYWNSAEKKGYSGTAVFSRKEAKLLATGLDDPEMDSEGRILALEYDRFILVNVYAPNARRELERLPLRMRWEDRFRAFLRRMDKEKPVVACGDMNVAHQKIDIRNPGPNRGNAGFTDEEREKMSTLLTAGFTDTFRKLYPDRSDAYTWWSYQANARERNIGWRLDYFLVSNRFMCEVEDSSIHPDVTGSDHCPVMLALKGMSNESKPAEVKGEPMKKQEPQKETYICTIDSPVGMLTAASDGEKITGLWLEGQKYYAATLPKCAKQTELPVFERLRTWLKNYFRGKNPAMDLPLAPVGSEFRQAVWKVLRAIPHGELVTYGDIARRLQKNGKAASAQAVGGAVGHNPISILIPCHRVVGMNGSLTGYAGGIDKKVFLLKLEGAPMEGLHIPKKGSAL